jgi:hypothetical protein
VQIERAADAGCGLRGSGRLDDVHLIKQCRGKRREIGLLRINLVGRNKNFAVQHRADLRQAAYAYRRADSSVAIDLHAGNALQGIGDRRVRQLANAFGRNAVLDARRVALHLYRANLRLAYACDNDFFQRVRRLGSGRLCRRCGLLRGRLARRRCRGQ